MLNKNSFLINDIEFVKLSQQNRLNWIEYLENKIETATPFHYPGWMDILVRNYKFRPFYYILKKNNKTAGVLPLLMIDNLRGRKLVSLPVSAYGGPVLDDPDNMSEVILFLERAGLEYHIYTKYKTESISSSFRKTDSIDYYSDITTKEGFYKLISKSTKIRHTILRCEKDGVGFFIGKMEYLKDFYKLLITTRKRQNSFIPSFDYFKDLFNSSIDMNIFICRYEGSPLSAVLAFRHNKKLYSIYNPSNSLSFEKRANEYLHAMIFDWAYNNDLDFYFGGTVEDPSFKGLHDFKRKWNVKREEIYEYTNREEFYVNRFKSRGVKIVRFIPDCVYTRIGKMIIKHLY